MSLETELVILLNNVSPVTLKLASLVSDSYYLLILIVIFLAFKSNREKGFFVSSILAFSVLINLILKYSFNMARPYEEIENLNIISTKITPSFPSQHAQLSFTAAALSSKLPLLFYLWAFIISLSRVVLGVHYLSDVIVGGILGYLIAKFSIKKKKKILAFLNHFETKRQLFHAIFGLLIALGIYVIPKNISIILLTFIILVGILLSILIRNKMNIPLITWIFNHLGRSRKIPFKGAIFFLIGSLLVVMIYPKLVAVSAIVILALQDSFATLIGKQYGKRRIFYSKHKTIEGTISGIVFGVIGASFLLPLKIAFIASLIAGILESIDFKVDDNLIIPLFTGFVISLLLY